MTKRERVLGSLIGYAIGDAMGATTEFMAVPEIREKYGVVSEIRGGGWLNLKPGQVTDDTQMSLVVYRAMRDTEGHPERTLTEICRGFRAWADSNPPDIGGACRRAIYGTKSLDPKQWVRANVRRQKAEAYHDLGNGGLMRCLVPCLKGDFKLALAQSNLTHSNGVHKAYIFIYYTLLQRALRGVKVSSEVWKGYPSGHVKDTFRNCEWWFITSGNFEDAILGAVNDGGDSDTIAALTGGLAGAFYGVDAIPKRWIEALDKEVLAELEECAEWLTK